MKRDPKKEDDQPKGRDFICSCGKNYLSYAALFTHIKQKHHGKAPGPIIRPRSQRKRGRPRKKIFPNQDIYKTNSSTIGNRNSVVNEIYNINLFQNKKLVAAQLLGCGEFNAFHFYRPQPSFFQQYSSIQTTERQLGQTSTNNQKISRNFENCQIFSEFQVNGLMHSIRLGSVSQQKPDSHYNSYPYNFVIMQLKDLLQGYQWSDQKESSRQKAEMFDWLGRQVSELKQSTENQNINKKNVSNSTVAIGIKTLLTQLQNHFEYNKLKQISFLFSLLCQYILKNRNKPLNIVFMDLPFSEFTKYTSSFLSNYLPLKIYELQVGDLYVFKFRNSANVILSLCNWISIQALQININVGNGCSKTLQNNGKIDKLVQCKQKNKSTEKMLTCRNRKNQKAKDDQFFINFPSMTNTKQAEYSQQNIQIKNRLLDIQKQSISFELLSQDNQSKEIQKSSSDIEPKCKKIMVRHR